MSVSIAVMGAGCVGAWLGAWLAQAGARVTLVGRPRLVDAVEQGGLSARQLTGALTTLRADQLTLTIDPSAVTAASLVLLCVKGRDTTAAARALAPHLREDAVLVSLQNGLRNPARIRAELPTHAVVPGMVPFNIFWEARPPAEGVHLLQATSGELVLGRHPGPELAQLLELFARAGLPARTHADMPSVQWAKLVLNLNNAIHALSGRSLHAELSDRAYRRLLAAAMQEAWRALDKAQIRPAAVGRMRPRLAPWILPLPDALFRIAAAPMLRIDPAASSSMADDLERGRRTEVEDIQGEVVALARSVGVPAPINARLLRLIHDAEARGTGRPRLSAAELWPPESP